MKLFGYEIKIERPQKAKAAPQVSIEDWVRGGDWPGAALASPYQQVVWVYRAVNALAEQVANMPFRFAAIGEGKDRISTGALQEFYSRPHPMVNGFQYWELRVIWLMLRGETIRVPIYKETTHGKRVLERVLLLDPAQFEHVVQDGRLVGWRYRGAGLDSPLESQVFLPEEIWHERLPNPFNFWRGMSPLSVAACACQSDWAGSQFMKGIMENNGDAGLIVSTAETLAPEQQEQLVGRLRERKRGLGTADKPLVLSGGLEVHPPQISAADWQLLEHRKFSVSEICAVFGVPVEVMTNISNVKYDIMSGARLQFIENRVVPFCRRLEAEEQVVVQAIDPRAKGFFEVEEHPVLAAARRERLKTAQAGFQMGVPLNELNRALDLGFKPFPWGDVGYVPSNMTKAKSF